MLEFIANKNVNNGFKGNLVKAYNYYAIINNIVWERPRYKWEQNKPKISSEEVLDRIIVSTGWKRFDGAALCSSIYSVLLRRLCLDGECFSINSVKLPCAEKEFLSSSIIQKISIHHILI